MAWREQIRPASFRGVPFGVTGADKSGGRRTVVHEFPQREEAYVEDLGASAVTFAVNAFVLGPDYMAARDALEQALNEPGPGTLVHPWYGEITVAQSAPYKVTHSSADGGMAVFSLTFTRDGAPASPTSGVNSQIRALNKAGAAGNFSCGAFDSTFLIKGQGAYVVEQAFQAVTTAFRRVQAVLGGDVNQIEAALAASTGYDFLPWASVGQNLWRAFQSLGAQSHKSAAGLAADWSTVAALPVPTPVAVNPGSTRARITANESAVNTFTRNIAVAEASRSLALAEPESRNHAASLREGFMDALDAVLVEELTLADQLYTAFVETRAASLAALATAARSMPEVVTYTPLAVLPSLAICHRLTGDIALDTDLCSRNHISHPGFVPAEPLEVLVYG